MTVTESSSSITEIIDELTQSSTFVDAMIGVGVVKDSEAVFFEYIGEKDHRALVDRKSGKPVKAFGNVWLIGISVAEDIGKFKSTKLNLYLRTGLGKTLLITSGLNTIWSQCVLTGLMGLLNDQYPLNNPISIDTWKGTSAMKPCFAAVKSNNQKFKDNDMYECLKEARAENNRAKVIDICRNAVEVINNYIIVNDELAESQSSVEVEVIDENTNQLQEQGDF
tara:strand:+ start:210 stop:878 length:669 start_codon:yes stop_codon:yes gene_type:complete